MARLPGLPRPPYSSSTLRFWWRKYLCNNNRHMVNTVLFGRSMPVPDVSVEAWNFFENSHHFYDYSPDPGSFWTYVCRTIGGTNVWSQHAYGAAGDKDPRLNPFKAATWDDTRYTPAHVDALLGLRTKNGKQVFAWGGQWGKRQDLMHWYLMCKPADLASGIDPDSVSWRQENDLDYRKMIDAWGPDGLEKLRVAGRWTGVTAWYFGDSSPAADKNLVEVVLGNDALLSLVKTDAPLEVEYVEVVKNIA